MSCVPVIQKTFVAQTTTAHRTLIAIVIVLFAVVLATLGPRIQITVLVTPKLNAVRVKTGLKTKTVSATQTFTAAQVTYIQETIFVAVATITVVQVTCIQ